MEQSVFKAEAVRDRFRAYYNQVLSQTVGCLYFLLKNISNVLTKLESVHTIIIYQIFLI